ncbi:metallophosphoesterase [Brevibacillus thermoruber]|uniref:Metallophosphoesterase n=1 Tax=Brevibacillus thermoruber TaxID=33942 RepID=A0A9X3Z1R6_9BACL|nr:metallophosphoesterase [Brevibacillus thermoruber]MDA5106982.1 metallophosphoesterase [Brevibacillus thermoruber]
MTKGIHWLLGLLGVGALCGAYGYGWERHQLEVVSLPVSLPDWPQALKGVRMVHFSDTHLGPYWGIEELRRVVDLINREKPDLICFTGDLVDKSTRLLSAAVPVLRALQAPLGKFAVLGNHDWRFGQQAVIHQALLDAEFQVLNNRHVRLPLIGHLATPELGQKYVSGLMQAGERGMPVYTNRGLGTTILPVRFLCRPEVTVLTLV